MISLSPVLRNLCLAGLVMAGAQAPLLASAEVTLRVMSFGGSYQDAQRKAQFEPFTKATGIQIVEFSWFADIGKVRAMVEAGNVTTDVILGDVAHAILGCQDGFL